VLDPLLTWRDVSRRLNEPCLRNRSLGSLYLDQGFLAGIGNYLRSEILFAVFARAGEPCLTCGVKVERVEVGSRRLYLCPTCQSAHQGENRRDRRHQ
jgi:formamidopyrimidine-DNA glycosylase